MIFQTNNPKLINFNDPILNTTKIGAGNIKYRDKYEKYKNKYLNLKKSL